MNRWAVFLDIEGVSKIFPNDEARFFGGFDALLDVLGRIGTLVYLDTPNRLFAHQVGGDGLLIVSEFAEGKPEVSLSIAIILMQVLLINGAVAKGGISEGGFGDIQNCFPSLGALPRTGDQRFRLGGGLLTVFPVMGTALINAHRFSTRPPRGCRLAVDSTLLKEVPLGVACSYRDSDLIVVDWIHTRTRVMDYIFDKTRLRLPSTPELESALAAYIQNTGELGKTEWGDNSLLLNGCEKRK